MKKRCLAVLMLALCLLTGCASLLEREYSTAEPHSSKFWESEAADTLRAEKSSQKPLFQAGNVEFCWNAEVTQVLGQETLTGIKLRDVNTGAESELPCDGLFISIGRRPETALVSGQLALDENGYVLADETTRTNLPGVFAVGDVRTKDLRQIITAAADGAIACHFAEEYLRGH